MCEEQELLKKNKIELEHDKEEDSEEKIESLGNKEREVGKQRFFLGRQYCKDLKNDSSRIQRTSRKAQKLKLLPENSEELNKKKCDTKKEDENNNFTLTENKEIYNNVLNISVNQITDKPARKDAEVLGKVHRSMLPRVTAYCTCGYFKMKKIHKWLNDKKRIHNTNPIMFDECIYTPFVYKNWRNETPNQNINNFFKPFDESNYVIVNNNHAEMGCSIFDKSLNFNKNDFEKNNNNDTDDILKFSEKKTEKNEILTTGFGQISNETKYIKLTDDGGLIHTGSKKEIFIFNYGVVVMWGFSTKDETSFLQDLSVFECEKLYHDDIQIEEFNYYITNSYQPRIYNDFITLRDDDNYMLKLAISHSISQSAKISLFEELVDNTIERTQNIPRKIAEEGKVKMSRDKIMKSIGELFILRININLYGSVLDSPELVWSVPHLDPIYQATRGYLEINQRVELLNQRLEVISDLLLMLKDQLCYSREENLELIVISLIGIELFISLIHLTINLIKK